MKKLILVLCVATIGFVSACKKEEEKKIDNSEPLEERLPGNWNVVEVDYSGQIIDQGNPNNSYPFNGTGESVNGFFKFDSDTNTGEFHITFVAKIDLGLSQPISYTVNEGQTGLWRIEDNEEKVVMWSNDTITNWEVLTNLPNEQKWKMSYTLDFGAPYDQVPVDIVARMER